MKFIRDILFYYGLACAIIGGIGVFLTTVMNLIDEGSIGVAVFYAGFPLIVVMFSMLIIERIRRC